MRVELTSLLKTTILLEEIRNNLKIIK